MSFVLDYTSSVQQSIGYHNENNEDPLESFKRLTEMQNQERDDKIDSISKAFESMSESFKELSNGWDSVATAVNNVYASQANHAYGSYTTNCLPAGIALVSTTVPVSEEICWKYNYYLDIRESGSPKYYITEYWMEVAGQKYKYHNPLLDQMGHTFQRTQPINNWQYNQLLTSAKPITIQPTIPALPSSGWVTTTQPSTASPHYTLTTTGGSIGSTYGGVFTIPAQTFVPEQQVWEGVYLDLITLLTHEKYEYRVLGKYLSQQTDG